MEELPPLIEHLGMDIAEFAAGAREASAIAAETTGASNTAFNGLASVGKAALIGVAGAAVVGGIAALKMAGDYEQATTRLVTSAGEQRANLDLVRKGMLQMAGDVGYSAQDLAKAMYTIESGGQHGAAGLLVLRAAAEGAKTENAELGTVADALTSILQDYHLKAADSAMVTSKLVAAVGGGKTTFEQLSGSLHSVLPVASAAHVSLDDILGDLASMTVHGMSADQAAQNLTDTIRHMQNPTAIQAKELALLGLNTQQLGDDLKSKGLSGTLQEITQRIEHLMPPGSDKVILNLKSALQGLSPAVQELGKHLFDGSMSAKDYGKAALALDPISAKQAVSFATLAGSMHRIGDVQMSGSEVMQNYGQALAKATGDATGLNVALMLTGENTAYTEGAIKAVSSATTEAGGHVRGWSEVQATFNQRWDRFVAGLGAGIIVIGTQLLPIAGAAIDKTMEWAGWLGRHHDMALMLAAAIGGPLLVAIGAYTITMTQAAVATIAATWPFLLALVAIAALSAGIALLVTHWNQIVNAVGPLRALGNAWKVLTDDLHHGQDVFTGLEDALQQLGVPANMAMTAGYNLRLAWAPIGSLLHTVGTLFKSVADDVRAGVPLWLMFENALQAVGVNGDVAIAVGARLRDVWAGVQRAGAELWKMLGQALGPALAQLGRDAGPMFARLGAAARSLVPVLQVVGAVLGAVLVVLGVALVAILGLAVGAIKGLAMALGVILPDAVHLAVTVVKLFAAAIKLAVDLVVGTVRLTVAIIRALFLGDWQGLWDTARDVFGGWVGDVTALFGDLFDAIGTILHAFVFGTLAFIQGFVSGVLGFFQWLANVLVGHSVIPDMVNAIVAAFAGMIGRVLGAVAGWVGGVVGQLQGMAAGAVGAVESMAANLIGQVQGIAGRIAGAASSIGTSIVNGITSGLRYAWGGLVATLHSLASSLPGPIQGALGITSPSRVFADLVGVPIAQGVALGIRRGTPAAHAALGDLTSAITPRSGALTVASAAAGGRIAPISMADTNELLAELYALLDERLPRPQGSFSTRAYGTA